MLQQHKTKPNNLRVNKKKSSLLQLIELGQLLIFIIPALLGIVSGFIIMSMKETKREFSIQTELMQKHFKQIVDTMDHLKKHFSQEITSIPNLRSSIYD